MKLAFYIGTRSPWYIGLGNRLVRLRLRSQISHCELLFEPGDGVDDLMPLDAIVGMGTQVNSAINSVSTLVLFAVVPFNLLKGVIVSALTFLLYKRISPILHKNDEKMLKRREKRASAADSSAKS